MDTTVVIGGLDYPVDADSAKILAAAEAHLRAQGKTRWTADELVIACEAVMPKLGLDRYPPTIA
jgi:hypothetical protein